MSEAMTTTRLTQHQRIIVDMLLCDSESAIHCIDGDCFVYFNDKTMTVRKKTVLSLYEKGVLHWQELFDDDPDGDAIYTICTESLKTLYLYL
jgi:hypothetical protein